MANQDIEITLTAIDEASDVIAEASERIDESCQQEIEAQNGVSDAVEASLPPLTESEQAQMANASAALQLSNAENNLRQAQNELNDAISQYGANSSEAADALRNLNNVQSEVKTLQTQVATSTKESEASLRSLTVGVSGAATAGFNLYNAYDRVNDSQISLDRSNLMVKSSTKSLEDAQRAVTEAISEHGVGSEQAQRAQENLSIAQDRLTVANERAQNAQENVNKAMLSAALQVIPSTITMVDSLSKVWKNFPDMTGVLETLSSNISMVGSKALIASVSVAGFVGGFVIGYEAITQFGDALGPTGRALMVIVPAIVAAAAAVWMLQEGLTLGVATVALVASGLAVGAMVANLQNYGNGLGQGSKVPALAAGGVVKTPTFALVGEEEPEIVMPLSKYEAQRSRSSTGSDWSNPQQVTVDLGGMHFYGDIADSKFLEKAADYTADKISAAVNLRRGT
jgi:hypothetical protein